MTMFTTTQSLRFGMRSFVTALAGGMLASLAQAGSMEVLVLDRDNKPLPDAVVIVLPSAPGANPKALPMTAVVNQEKMQFVPRVTVVGLGAKVQFTNSDAWDHHVRLTTPGSLVSATPSNTDGLSLRLEGKSEGKPPSSTVLTLDKPGPTGAVLLGCFIHGSISGHVYVAESPWTVKTGAHGIAKIDNVPDGSSTVKVWQALQLV